jgi:hypothetical protein
MVQWASGATTWNALNLMFSDDPMSASICTMRNTLLQTPGWKRCKPCIKNAKKFGCVINRAKLHNLRRWPVYKYGHQVPRDQQEAVFIGQKNGYTESQDAEEMEIRQLKDYDTIRNLSLAAPRPEGFIMIPCRPVHDCKHNGHHKARFV